MSSRCFAFSLAAVTTLVFTVACSAPGFAAERKRSLVTYDEVTLSPDATKIASIETESALDLSGSSHNAVTIRDIHGSKIGGYDPCAKCGSARLRGRQTADRLLSLEPMARRALSSK